MVVVNDRTHSPVRDTTHGTLSTLHGGVQSSTPENSWDPSYTSRPSREWCAGVAKVVHFFANDRTSSTYYILNNNNKSYNQTKSHVNIRSMWTRSPLHPPSDRPQSTPRTGMWLSRDYPCPQTAVTLSLPGTEPSNPPSDEKGSPTPHSPVPIWDCTSIPPTTPPVSTRDLPP